MSNCQLKLNRQAVELLILLSLPPSPSLSDVMQMKILTTDGLDIASLLSGVEPENVKEKQYNSTVQKPI